MAGITLETAKRHLDAWLEAELAVTNAQSYTIGSRTMTKANLTEIRKSIEYWQGKVTALENVAKYGGSITEVTDPELSVYEKYQGWNERVWGNEIITILRGARKYSGYDIEPFIEKLKWKKEYMQTDFPDPFDPERWNRIDVDELFAED